MIRLIVLCLGIFVSFGCVSTNLRGDVQPGFENVKFQKLLVYCDVTDNAWRDSIETVFARAATTPRLEVYPSISVLTEARAYTDEETAAIMTREGFDGMVRIHLDEYSSAVRRAPGGYATYYGPYGPVIVERPPQRFESTRLIMHVDIVDRATNRVAWAGELVSSGGGIRDLDELAAAAGAKVRNHLFDNDLVGSR